MPIVSREEREAIDAFLLTLVPEPLDETIFRRILTRAGLLPSAAVWPRRSTLLRWEEADPADGRHDRKAAHGWLCLSVLVGLMVGLLLGPGRMTNMDGSRAPSVAVGRCPW